MTTSENIPLEARILEAILPMVPAPPKTVTFTIPPAFSKITVLIQDYLAFVEARKQQNISM
jgi:hypothetical protein